MASQRSKTDNQDASAPSEPKVAGNAPRKPKRDRIPFHQIGGRRNLYVPEAIVEAFEQIGFHLCWANDDMGNLDGYIAAGCEFVERKEVPPKYSVGDPNVDAGDSSKDTRISVVVGLDRTEKRHMRAYLMKKPIEFHEEDMRFLAEMNNEVERAIRRGAFKQDGGAEQEVEHAYGTVRTGKS